MSYTNALYVLFLIERIFIGRSHVAKVAEARVDAINSYCQVSSVNILYTLHLKCTYDMHLDNGSYVLWSL